MKIMSGHIGRKIYKIYTVNILYLTKEFLYGIPLMTKLNIVKHIFSFKRKTKSHYTYYPRAGGAKRRARVLIPPGYLHPGKRKH